MRTCHASRVPSVDLIDETWVRAGLAEVAAAVGDPVRWRRWFAHLDLDVHERRGRLGQRWWVRPSGRHRLAGSMEIWLEPRYDGVLLHYFVRLDPVDGRALRASARRRARTELAVRAKSAFFGLKDELEGRRR